MGVGVWVWGFGFWALGPNPQSPIPNPQSPIPNPHVFYHIILILNKINIIFDIIIIKDIFIILKMKILKYKWNHSKSKGHMKNFL